MKPHAIALIVVLFQVSGLSAARAQDASGLRIVVQVKVGRQDGGDRRSTGGFIDPGASERLWRTCSPGSQVSAARV